MEEPRSSHVQAAKENSSLHQRLSPLRSHFSNPRGPRSLHPISPVPVTVAEAPLGFVGYYVSLHSWKSTSASVLQITLRRTSTTVSAYLQNLAFCI
ncbi:hypothetical protein MRB53_023120 [Persea americana]|uniref:Uncharacterized protein n=1 Tax=Persea americana TaxID=3435 RepID=A0ACC2L8X0_PERAE|nr:hypothetical protein MRB53_023120 [Persea americana]